MHAATVAPDGARVARPRWRRVLLIVIALLAAAAVVSSPWWAPIALSQLNYFNVRNVELDGVRIARPADLVRTLRVDTSQSVWQSLPALERRMEKHPLVSAVVVERRLPGTIVVHVSEREPIALVQSAGSLRPVDVTGTILPIDPVETPLDVPVVSSRDSTLLRFLDGLRQEAPALFARVSSAQRVNSEELRLMLGSMSVRTMADVTVSRFKDILPVEEDLARNHLRAVELDLRFREQVIVRQP
jgi:cell division protein FtsQ